MSQDSNPIFDYLDEMKAELKADIKDVKNSVNILQTSVNNLTHMVKGFQEEMIINRNRIDRLEAWVKEASVKLGIPSPF